MIRDTLTTFTTTLKTPDGIRALIKEKSALGHGFLVSGTESTLLGFAHYGPFRNGPGYAYTMEHSINLAPTAQGSGTGRTLMVELENHAATQNVHSLIAGISAANTAGIAFHHAIGYKTVATLPEVGFKFDQWLDLVLMQKIL